MLTRNKKKAISIFVNFFIYFREQLKLEPRDDIDLPGVNKTNWQNSKEIIERLTKQVSQLQNERVSLRTKVRDAFVITVLLKFIDLTD